MKWSSLSCPSVFLSVFVLIAVAGFLAARTFVGSPAGADDPVNQIDTQPGDSPVFPIPEGTPVPGATPDKTRPDWYVPYWEAEQAAPRFRGNINGIELGVSSGPTPLCGQTQIRPDSDELTAGTPFDINIGSLSARIRVYGLPDVGQCVDDGRIMWIIANLEVTEGPGVSGTVGVVQVSRWEAVRWYPQKFLADRVTAGTIAGRPAAFADVGQSGIGQTAVFVIDVEIGGSTMLLSSNVSLEYLKAIAEELYK